MQRDYNVQILIILQNWLRVVELIITEGERIPQLNSRKEKKEYLYESTLVCSWVKYPLPESRWSGKKEFDGMCKVPLIILYIIISLTMFLLDLRLGKSRNCNIEVTLEYEERSFSLWTDSSLLIFKLVWDRVPNGRSVFKS